MPTVNLSWEQLFAEAIVQLLQLSDDEFLVILHMMIELNSMSRVVQREP